MKSTDNFNRTDVRQTSDRTEDLSGIPSGFHELDRMTSGWQNSDLVIIAARPAMGKTSFVLSMARNMAAGYNIPVGLFSLEMSSQQLYTRIAHLQGTPVYVEDKPDLSVFELCDKARWLVTEHGVKIIMIDYLQLVTTVGRQRGSSVQKLSVISHSLKALARELDIPIIAMFQLNHGVETRREKGQRPQLDDLHESGVIDQDADMVCFIHRPEYYRIYEDDKGNNLRGLAEFIIAKHRSGSVGDVCLEFRGEFQNLNGDKGLSCIPI